MTQLDRADRGATQCGRHQPLDRFIRRCQFVCYERRRTVKAGVRRALQLYGERHEPRIDRRPDGLEISCSGGVGVGQPSAGVTGVVLGKLGWWLQGQVVEVRPDAEDPPDILERRLSRLVEEPQRGQHDRIVEVQRPGERGNFLIERGGFASRPGAEHLGRRHKVEVPNPDRCDVKLPNAH